MESERENTILFLSSLLLYFSSFLKLKSTHSRALKYGFMACPLASPFSSLVRHVWCDTENSWDVAFYRIEYFVRDVIEGRRDPFFEKISYEGYSSQLMFYVLRMRETGFSVEFTDWKNLGKDRRVLASEEEVCEGIEERYATDDVMVFHTDEVVIVSVTCQPARTNVVKTADSVPTTTMSRGSPSVVFLAFVTVAGWSSRQCLRPFLDLCCARWRTPTCASGAGS